ncbi:MAG: hypothetical protein P8Z40_02325 [Chloroflexota bacterium]
MDTHPDQRRKEEILSAEHEVYPPSEIVAATANIRPERGRLPGDQTPLAEHAAHRVWRP